MAGLHFDITGDNTNLLRKLQETENGVKSVSRTVEKEGGNIEDLFNRLARSAAVIGVGFSAKEFISKAAQMSVFRPKNSYRRLHKSVESSRNLKLLLLPCLVAKSKLKSLWSK